MRAVSSLFSQRRMRYRVSVSSQVEMNRNELPDAYVVVYSVIDKTSFKTVEDELARLQNWDALRSRSLIVVGNKIDLVRSRAVSTQGKWARANCCLFTLERALRCGHLPTDERNSSALLIFTSQCASLVCRSNSGNKYRSRNTAPFHKSKQMANVWRALTAPNSWRCRW